MRSFSVLASALVAKNNAHRIGDCTGDESIEDAQPVCTPSGLSLSVSKCYFLNNNINPADVYLAGITHSSPVAGSESNSCRGTEDGDSYNFQISPPFSDCGTNISHNTTHLIYKNALQFQHGVRNGVINRLRRFKADFACSFEREQTVSSIGIMTSLTNVDLDLGATEGTFELEMGVYPDDSYDTAVAENYQISVPDPIFVAVKINDDQDQRLKVQLKKCWATPDNDPNNEMQYPFIDDFCGDNLEVNVYESLVVNSNGAGDLASFAIESFTFHGGSGDLFLHCSIRVCDSEKEDCVPSCDDSLESARKRRSAATDSAVSMSLGPIHMKERKRRPSFW